MGGCSRSFAENYRLHRPSEVLTVTEADRRFLVNLTEDATEMTNLAEQYPQVVERLEQLPTD